MPIVVPKADVKMKKLSIQLPENLLQEIEAYCNAFGVKDVEDFLCQAGHYVLKTDRDWVKIKNQKLDAHAQ
jgi:metal-responsive CopG/Arc/MetJ family transcriptional regulator